MSTVSAIELVSPYLKIKHRRVSPLRGVVGYASEAEQKQRASEVRKRLNKPLQMPIPSVVEKRKTVFVSKPKPVENLDWGDYTPVVSYDSYIPHPIKDWEQTIHNLLRQHGYRIEQVRGDVRTKHLVECRRQIARYLREECQWSYPHIARFMKRDHSSIISLLGLRGRKTGTNGDHTGKRLTK